MKTLTFKNTQGKVEQINFANNFGVLNKINALYSDMVIDLNCIEKGEWFVTDQCYVKDARKEKKQTVVNAILLKSVGTWVEVETLRTTGAAKSDTQNKGVQAWEFENETNLFTDEISVDWVNSLSEKDEKLLCGLIMMHEAETGETFGNNCFMSYNITKNQFQIIAE